MRIDSISLAIIKVARNPSVRRAGVFGIGVCLTKQVDANKRLRSFVTKQLLLDDIPPELGLNG